MKKQNVCEFLSFVSLRVWEFMVAPPRPTGTPHLFYGLFRTVGTVRKPQFLYF